jgi:uncharacterized damage-inducible protein DinB
MRTGWLACACAVALEISAPALAQQKESKTDKKVTQPSPFVEVTRLAWYNINDLVLASAARMREEDYGFKPTKDVRTFAQILTHIASDHHALCGPTVGRSAPDINFDKLKTKEQITKVLQESSAVCDMAYGLLNTENAAFRYRAIGGEYSRAALLMSNITHDSEHYGNLVTYMRLKGVVPPSSAGVRWPAWRTPRAQMRANGPPASGVDVFWPSVSPPRDRRATGALDNGLGAPFSPPDTCVPRSS